MIQRHVLSLELETNPAVVRFDTPYRNVTGLEVRKSLITRSERMIELYRNTPFILLDTYWAEKVDFDNPFSDSRKDFQKYTGVDPVELRDALIQGIISDNFSKLHVKIEPFRRFSSTGTELWRCWELGIIPCVLDGKNLHSTEELQNAINQENIQKLWNGITNIYVGTYYNGKSFQMMCIRPFIIIPGDACELVGLRKDFVYVSYFYAPWSMFLVDGEAPKMNNMDVLNVTCKELKGPMAFSTTGYYPLYRAFLDTPPVGNQVVLGSEYLIPKVNTLQNNGDRMVTRKIDEVPKLFRITLSLLLDSIPDIYYRLNGTKWYVDVVLTCRTEAKIYNAPVTRDPMRHVVPLTLSKNKETVVFEDPFRNVTSIEILRSYMTRSERMVESYRNVPFIALSWDWHTRFDVDDLSDPRNINFRIKTGIDPRILINILSRVTSMEEDQRFIPIKEEGGGIETFDQFPEAQWDEQKCYLYEDFRDCGIMPYIINFGKYGVSSLEYAFRMLRFLTDMKYHDHSDIDIKLCDERVCIEMTKLCVIIPSNAASLFGLRNDGIYVPGFKRLLDGRYGYSLTGDFVPKLDGPDVLYITSPDIRFRDENNNGFITLSTVYLKNTYNSSSLSSPRLQSTIQVNDNQLIERPLNSTIPRLPKISFEVFSDQKKRHPYLFNGNPWYIDLLIVTEY